MLINVKNKKQQDFTDDNLGYELGESFWDSFIESCKSIEAKKQFNLNKYLDEMKFQDSLMELDAALDKIVEPDLIDYLVESCPVLRSKEDESPETTLFIKKMELKYGVYEVVLKSLMELK